jgi:hypothetical protein
MLRNPLFSNNFILSPSSEYLLSSLETALDGFIIFVEAPILKLKESSLTAFIWKEIAITSQHN